MNLTKVRDFFVDLMVQWDICFLILTWYYDMIMKLHSNFIFLSDFLTFPNLMILGIFSNFFFNWSIYWILIIFIHFEFKSIHLNTTFFIFLMKIEFILEFPNLAIPPPRISGLKKEVPIVGFIALEIFRVCRGYQTNVNFLIFRIHLQHFTIFPLITKI